nr:MAG TPA: hypothetical protein [Caudoviricetes sp.]
MSLSHDLACAESDVKNINFEQEYDELISDISAVYNRYDDTFKNALFENTGAIIDLLIERCSQDIFAYAALVYVLCSEFLYTNEGFLSHTMTYQESLKKLREEAEKDALLYSDEAC